MIIIRYLDFFNISCTWRKAILWLDIDHPEATIDAAHLRFHAPHKKEEGMCGVSVSLFFLTIIVKCKCNQLDAKGDSIRYESS